jgi:hypothetical protein
VRVLVLCLITDARHAAVAQRVVTASRACDLDHSERGGERHPRDRGLRHRVAPRDISLRFALRKALESLCALVSGQRRRPTETDATRLRTRSAVACARPDKLTLELGKTTEHGESRSDRR